MTFAVTEEHQLRAVGEEVVGHAIEAQRESTPTVRLGGPVGLRPSPLVPDHRFVRPVVRPQVVSGIPSASGRVGLSER